MKALLFDIYKYNRFELAKMSDSQLYELAYNGSFIEQAQMMSLDEFQEALNDEEVDVVNNWVFFIS